MKVVALVGRSQSGKSTMAGYLKKFGFIRRAFADRLKEGMATAFMVPVYWFYDVDLKEIPRKEFGGKSPREVLQLMGTEGARNLIWHKIWADVWRREVKVLMTAEPTIKIVVDDLRFREELMVIRELGGKVWGIVRDEQKYLNHDSEVYVEELLSSADCIFSNNGEVSSMIGWIEHRLENWQ